MELKILELEAQLSALQSAGDQGAVGADSPCVTSKATLEQAMAIDTPHVAAGAALGVADSVLHIAPTTVESESETSDDRVLLHMCDDGNERQTSSSVLMPDDPCTLPKSVAPLAIPE